MESYQQGVYEEALELNDKLAKLIVFQRSITFSSLPDMERNLLFLQARHMLEYCQTLCERIVHFSTKA